MAKQALLAQTWHKLMLGVPLNSFSSQTSLLRFVSQSGGFFEMLMDRPAMNPDISDEKKQKKSCRKNFFDGDPNELKGPSNYLLPHCILILLY